MKKILLVFLGVICIYTSKAQNCRLSCVSKVNVSLMPNDCIDTLSALSFLNNPSVLSPTCRAYQLVILYPFGTHKFTPANVVDKSHVGYTMKFQVFDSVSRNSCWGYLTVNKCDPCLIPTPPVITSFTITPPVGPYPLNDTVLLEATATDNVGIVKVEFYDGIGLLKSDPSFPYNLSYITAAYKTYNFRAIAYDDCGRKDTSDIITINPALPTCSDGVKNGSETGTDCGGPNCAPCPGPPPVTCNSPVILNSGSATQSSTYYSNTAAKARDGSTYTYSLTASELKPWWQLDLGAQFVVSSIEIKHRSCYGCSNYLIRNNVFISATAFSSDINVVKANSSIYEFPYVATNLTLNNINIKGRYLRIWSEYSSPNSLSLLEVKVTGCSMVMPLAAFSGSLAANENKSATQAQVVNIYPNPSSDKVFITLDKSFHDAEVTLTDYLGRTVLNKRISDPEVDIKSLHSGYYIMKLNIDGSNSVHKIFKN